ncbi:MAG: hypothetical protein IKU80_02485 [Firmicutes bacterium]|nr:hypothetical protein [Bacillota bacterium]
MIIKNKELSEVEITEKVICNCCGEEIKKNAHGYLQDYIHIEKKWGYTSENDGKEDLFDVCEKCWFDITKKFKYKP